MLCRGPRMLFFGQNMLDIMAFCTSETICFPWAIRIMSLVGCYFNNVGVSCGIDICHPALRKPPTMLIQGTDDGRATAAQVTRRRTRVAGGMLIPNSVRLLRRTATPQKLSPGARGLCQLLGGSPVFKSGCPIYLSTGFLSSLICISKLWGWGQL